MSSSIDLHKAIKKISIELGKKDNPQLPITQKDLIQLVKGSPDVIRALALQLHHRLSKMIF